MVRISIIIGLIVSLFFLVRGTVNIWENENDLETTVAEVSRSSTMPLPISERFYPAVPEILPDLSKNYLFNEERNLELEEEIAEEEPETGIGIADDVDFATVNYVGSIIGGKVKKAIVSYSKYQPTKRERPARAGRAKRKPQRAGSAMEQATLQLGDTFGGMKVAEIEPDRIAFEGDGDRIEKFLYDPNKKRLAPPKVLAKPARPRQKAVAKGGKARAKKPAGTPKPQQRAGQAVRARQPAGHPGQTVSGKVKKTTPVPPLPRRPTSRRRAAPSTGGDNE